MSNDVKKSQHDHESDPAHTPGDGWVDEGGASHLGPATHTTKSDPDEVAGEHNADVSRAKHADTESASASESAE
ncbi:hypothetical protein [Leucobacter denitrificans]|uniref:Uncharacterized protein n=1 Tax=Leucobacter denitrificans TaxID=683042 RepID=A0A7G9S2I5_9MICO|nr:hypothetical protein [Leucobacter denitrificans]QNN62060.1 hypothetical protein H9L06_06995 [Leucobacter denitrificans]